MADRFEQLLEESLNDEMPLDASRRIGVYKEIKRRLCNDVYSEIKGAEPSLSDHSERHINNVLRNVRKLIGEDKEDHELTAIELYCLALFVLFHDVGNVSGRENHHQKIGEVYEWARGNAAEFRRERTLVMRVAGAHTGTASDGSRDTLKELDDNDHMDDHPVRARELGAILRFADELAEGPQRTSDFIQTHGGYSADSEIFHEYASVTHINIDRAGGRIRLTYEVDVKLRDGESEESRIDRVRELLKFIYSRIIKLDQERRYARYYSTVLSPFKTTSIEINFTDGAALLPLSLPKLTLDDKVIPGDLSKSLEEYNDEYAIEAIINKMKEILSKRED